MKSIRFLIFLCFTTNLSIAQFKSPGYLSTSTKFKLGVGVSSKDYLANTIIFKVKEEFRGICSKYAVNNSSLSQALTLLEAKQMAKKFPHHIKPESKHNQYGQPLADLSLIYEFNYEAAYPIEYACNLLLKTGLFEFVEPHYLPHLSYQPNDPFATISGQYHLNKINAYTAWDITKGDTNIVIGITDTGVELTHPDLTGNIKFNYADPIDGIDNDGDSLIDNYYGWDVGENDNDPTWQGNPHGVHVSGCAAAVTDNGSGGAGVGFNTKFLPVKIADANGDLTGSYEGIIYAADHGCSIINCSWGGPGGGQFGQTAINYATINKNALVVCAAGNDNGSTDHFPSAYNYALSVASTTSNDNKSGFSNYGYSIDVCAPGSNINATYVGGSYNQLSGTSMASPITAGAAALVKSIFPQYTALQIGEQLKATCDAINIASSGTYLGKLGKGRINLFQATTNGAAKSVTMTDRTVTDQNDLVFVGNDTLRIGGEYTNFLNPLNNLNISLNSTSPYVSILNPTINVGAMASMQIFSNTTNPFLVKINPAAPANTVVNFRVNFTDGSYIFNYYFSVTINVDYINVTINDISSTITSKGRIGFNSDSQADGLGFKYKNGRQLLYEAGLMLGASSSKVSDVVRGVNAGVSDEDFISNTAVREVVPSVKSAFDLAGDFTDAIATLPIDLYVKHKAFAWNSPNDRKYIMVEYNIQNNSLSNLTNLYAGIFADWDIDDSTYASNRAEFDPNNRMGYAYYTGANGTYTGIQLLTNSAPVKHYAVDNVSGGAGGVDLTDGTSEAEKYLMLSTNRAIAGASGTGADIIDVVSTGPFSLASGDSIIVAFALLAGDSLADLQNSAFYAQTKYDSLLILRTPSESKDFKHLQVFPNPAKDELIISYMGTTDTEVSLINLQGQLVIQEKISFVNGNSRRKLDVKSVPSGIYMLQLKSAKELLTRKVVIE